MLPARKRVKSHIVCVAKAGWLAFHSKKISGQQHWLQIMPPLHLTTNKAAGAPEQMLDCNDIWKGILMPRSRQEMCNLFGEYSSNTSFKTWYFKHKLLLLVWKFLGMFFDQRTRRAIVSFCSCLVWVLRGFAFSPCLLSHQGQDCEK